MTKLEFEYMAGCQVTDDEYHKIELVMMNTREIRTTQQMVTIFRTGGMETVNVLFSLVQERGSLIDTVGELKQELSDEKKEARKLKQFRDAIVKEAERRQR